MSDLYANYLLDLGRLIRESGEATKTAVAAAAENDRQFQQGRQMAYYEVLSLMQQQAVAFDLPLDDLSLDGFDADRDLL
jgi:hypothetical protein